MNTLAKTIATGFGSGYLPVAPGTWGALLAALMTYVIAIYFDLGIDLNYWLIGLSVVFTVLGIWSANVLQDEWGHDPGTNRSR